MPPAPALPPHVLRVDSFEALLNVPFEGSCNAICWERTLEGDFDEVARRLPLGGGLAAVDEVELRKLPVHGAAATAVATLLADLRGLREAGFAPELDVVEAYARDADEVLPTDVHSFHVDSANVPAQTFLCTYSGAPSEALAVAQAERCVDIPTLRAALLARHGGPDDERFAAWLRERHYDLHYRPTAGARAFSLGTGHLWRLAVQYPGSPVPACIHRAPPATPGRARRLLLIS